MHVSGIFWFTTIFHMCCFCELCRRYAFSLCSIICTFQKCESRNLHVMSMCILFDEPLHRSNCLFFFNNGFLWGRCAAHIFSVDAKHIRWLYLLSSFWSRVLKEAKDSHIVFKTKGFCFWRHTSNIVFLMFNQQVAGVAAVYVNTGSTYPKIIVSHNEIVAWKSSLVISVRRALPSPYSLQLHNLQFMSEMPSFLNTIASEQRDWSVW